MKTSEKLKSWLIGLLGFLNIILVLYMIYLGKADFIWEGIAGLSVGAVFILAPKTMIKLFSSIIDKLTPKVPKV